MRREKGGGRRGKRRSRRTEEGRKRGRRRKEKGGQELQFGDQRHEKKKDHMYHSYMWTFYIALSLSLISVCS